MMRLVLVLSLGLAMVTADQERPDYRAELTGGWILDRCVPWVVAHTGNPDDTQDPLVCTPMDWDEFEGEFFWDWS